MRPPLLFQIGNMLFLFLPLAIGLPASVQSLQAVKDPQAIAVIQQAVAIMGGTVPQDSVSSGTVTLVAGSETQNGTIRILTRGVAQTSEIIQLANTQVGLIYSGGQADEVSGMAQKPLPLELALTSQCPDFPLPVFAGALAESDNQFIYVGIETLAGTPVHHVRIWRSFASTPNLQNRAEFSTREVWIDASTGLPVKYAYIQRAGGGAAVRVPVEVFYSDYRSVGGVLYPFAVRKSLNGTPWESISVQQVQFNTGLTDSNFSLK